MINIREILMALLQAIAGFSIVIGVLICLDFIMSKNTVVGIVITIVLVLVITTYIIYDTKPKEEGRCNANYDITTIGRSTGLYVDKVRQLSEADRQEVFQKYIDEHGSGSYTFSW